MGLAPPPLSFFVLFCLARVLADECLWGFLCLIFDTLMYIYVDFHKLVPQWAAVDSPMHESDDDEECSESVKHLAKVLGAPSKTKKPLGIMQWSLAMDRYMIAAPAARQMSAHAVWAHKEICMKVGIRAQISGRRAFLGQIYDELCRRRWAERAYSGEEWFDVDQVCLAVDKEILSEAEAVFDATAKAKGASSSLPPLSKGYRKGAGKGYPRWNDKGYPKWNDKGVEWNPGNKRSSFAGSERQAKRTEMLLTSRV